MRCMIILPKSTQRSCVVPPAHLFQPICSKTTNVFCFPAPIENQAFTQV